MLIVLLLAALPLRGYANAIQTLCEAHHGGVPVAEAHAHAPGDNRGVHDGDAEQPGFSSLCNLCSTCSVGAPLVADVPRAPALVAPGSAPIPFVLKFRPDVPLDQLDRPPLAS